MSPNRQGPNNLPLPHCAAHTWNLLFSILFSSILRMSISILITYSRITDSAFGLYCFCIFSCSLAVLGVADFSLLTASQRCD